MKLFNNHTHKVLAEKMAEVGRMIGGWPKSVPGLRAASGLSPDHPQRVVFPWIQI
jgi:hypothetical protein